MSSVDLALFGWINNAAGRSGMFDAVILALNHGGPWVFLAVMGLLWFGSRTSRRQGRRLVVWAIMAALLALGINTLISFIYYRPRPFTEHEVTLLVTGYPAPAFPSSHAVAEAALAVVLARRSRAVAWALWAVVWASAYARVFVGVHYPGDVVGGIAIGWVTALFVRRHSDVLQVFADRIAGGRVKG